MELIDVANHQHCMDRTAKIVWSQNHGRIPAVYAVKAGFIATVDGTRAFDVTFATLDEAREAALSAPTA